jgi:hypothetical protein
MLGFETKISEVFKHYFFENFLMNSPKKNPNFVKFLFLFCREEE